MDKIRIFSSPYLAEHQTAHAGSVPELSGKGKLHRSNLPAPSGRKMLYKRELPDSSGREKLCRRELPEASGIRHELENALRDYYAFVSAMRKLEPWNELYQALKELGKAARLSNLPDGNSPMEDVPDSKIM